MMHGHSSAEQTAATSGKVIHWAPFYDVVVFLMTFGREKRVRRETVERAGVAPGQSVLDVGCGTGTLTLVAKSAAGPRGQVSGIDPSPEMVEAAKRKAARARADVDFRVGVVEALPFPDTTFDVVLSSLMLHHLPEDVKRKGFEEIARVLRPDGVFFAVDLSPGPHGLAGHLRAVFGHGMGGGLESTAAMLEAAGFEDVSSGPMTLGPLGFLRGKRA